MKRMNLLKLLKDNNEKPRSWALKAEGDDATLYVYDVIGGAWGGVDAEVVVRSLAASTASTIHVRINSPGGDVFDAVAIANALRAHPATVVAHIDGLAASAATSISLACDRVEIAQDGMYMIHNAWTLAMGNRHDMLDVATLLEKVDGNIARGYAGKTGSDIDQVQAWMDGETWFTADEAKAAGFVDEIITGNKAKADWNLSAYDNAPEPEAKPEFDISALDRKFSILENLTA